MNEIETIEQSRVLVAESMSAGVLSDKHIQARVNMIQGAIKNIFKSGVHYGVIPGTQKPTLYKPGAEQLLVMFRIAPAEPKIEDLSTPDLIRYRVTRSGISQNDGKFLGSGVGECSSDEEKYKWRKPVCSAEFDETPVDRRREVWKRAYNKTEKVKQVRTNSADLANTILKMADKRSMVAMTLCVTGASDAFSQDIEDLPEEIREQISEEERTIPPVQQPARSSASANASAVSTPTPAPAPANGVKVITLPQAKRYFAIAKGAGKTDDEIKSYLASIGIQRSSEMPVDRYEAACAWAASKTAVVNTDTGEVLLQPGDFTESPGVGE